MTKRTHDIVERLQEPCEYCGQEERYGHNAICVMNTVEELRAEIERLRASIAWTREVRPGKNAESGGAIVHMTWDQFNTMRAALDPKP